MLKSMESLRFTLPEFEEACERRRTFLPSDTNPLGILIALFQFSLIGYYAPGGSAGGSEYIFKYKDPTAQFNEAATGYRIHPGLKEVLGSRTGLSSNGD